MVFTRGSKSDWFCITNWLKKTRATVSTNQKSLVAHVYPRFALATVFTLSFDWFVTLSVSLMIGQSDYFGFGRNWKTHDKRLQPVLTQCSHVNVS